MSKMLLPTILALAATALAGPAVAQAGPMVPSATPGNGPVMPTAPAQPMPMPGSNGPGGPMIPQTMPGMPAASGVPTPMPGTTDTSKPAIQINVTLVDAPPNFALTAKGSRDTKTGIQDDLHDARVLAAARHIVLTSVAGPTVMTLDGAPVTLTTGTPVPYTPKPSDPAAKGKKAVTLTVGDTLMVTPRLNPDGTVTVRLSFTQTQLAGAAWSQIGPPKTETRSFDATKTFGSGDTLLLGRLTGSGPGTRLLYATTTVFTPGKG